MSTENNDQPAGKPLRCFVCGQLCTCLNDLREHLYTNHVVERDYLVCAQCGVPVIDLSLHYKVHHKTCKMQPGATRVEKLYEWDSARKLMKKKRARKTKWKEGHFFSEKNQKSMHYRSSWEQKVMVIFELSPRVEAYNGEPFSIPYSYRGTYCHYWPDFIVKFKDGTCMLLEIKPQNQCDAERNKAKWVAAMNYAAQHGQIFRVWTEVMIGKLAKLAVDPQSLNESVMCV